jgi:hypothetical protein
MLKNSLVFLATLLLLGACTAGPSEENSASPEPAASEPVATASAESAKTAEPAADVPKSSLKPSDVEKGKPIDALELRNAALNDPDAWKGVEVTVKGGYNGHSTSTTDYGKTIMINIRVGSENVGTCVGKEDPPADVKERRNDRVYEGKISRVLKTFKQFELEDCKMTG